MIKTEQLPGLWFKMCQRARCCRGSVRKHRPPTQGPASTEGPNPCFSQRAASDARRRHKHLCGSRDPSTWDLSMDLGLTTGKHYEFYAAICGVRNESGISPPFPCRGLPPKGVQHVRIEGDDPNVGWLTLSETRQALQHMHVDSASLKPPIQMLLRAMQAAEDLYGHNRVRLVFQVSD